MNSLVYINLNLVDHYNKIIPQFMHADLLNFNLFNNYIGSNINNVYQYFMNILQKQYLDNILKFPFVK